MPRRPRHRPRPRSLVADALAGLTALTALAVAGIGVGNLMTKGPAEAPEVAPHWFAADSNHLEPPMTLGDVQIAANSSPSTDNEGGWIEAAGHVSLIEPMPITSEVTLAALTDQVSVSETAPDPGRNANVNPAPVPLDVAAVAGAPVPFPIQMPSTSPDPAATASNGAVAARATAPGGFGPRPRPTELALLAPSAKTLGPRHRPSR